MDKITKTIFFCKKVFVSTCLHCCNAATPLNTIYKHVMYVSICEYTEINVLFLGVGLLWHHICVNVMIGLFYLTHRSKSVTNIKLSSTTRVYFAPALPTSSNQNVHHIRNLCPSLWCKTTNFFFQFSTKFVFVRVYLAILSEKKYNVQHYLYDMHQDLHTGLKYDNMQPNLGSQ